MGVQEILELLVRLVGELAWPAAVLLVALILKNDLSNLLSRIRQVSYKDVSAEFETKVKELSEQAEEAIPKPISGDEPQALPSPGESAIKERLSRIAGISPRAAILESWIEVTQKLILLAKAKNMHRGDWIPPAKLVARLASEGILGGRIVRIFTQLRQLRNQAAHVPDFVLATTEAEGYVETSLELSDYFSSLARQRETERETGSSD